MHGSRRGRVQCRLAVSVQDLRCRRLQILRQPASIAEQHEDFEHVTRTSSFSADYSSVKTHILMSAMLRPSASRRNRTFRQLFSAPGFPQHRVLGGLLADGATKLPSPMEDRGRVPDSPDFGALLRHYRLAAGLSQEALAERARMSTQGISALERGYRRTPQRETLALLVGALVLNDEQRGKFEAYRCAFSVTRSFPRDRRALGRRRNRHPASRADQFRRARGRARRDRRAPGRPSDGHADGGRRRRQDPDRVARCDRAKRRRPMLRSASWARVTG